MPLDLCVIEVIIFYFLHQKFPSPLFNLYLILLAAMRNIIFNKLLVDFSLDKPQFISFQITERIIIGLNFRQTKLLRDISKLNLD